MVMRHSTTAALVEQTFKEQSSAPAYSCMGYSMSFSELDKLSQQFSKYLIHSLKLVPGDRLAVQLPNILQFPVVMYGAIRSGIVLVNLNPLYTEREIKELVKDSGAKAMVVLSNVALNASKVIDETDVENVIVTDIGDLHPAPKRLLLNFVVKYIKKMVPEYTFKNEIKFRDCLNHTLPDLPENEIKPDDLLMLQYTGGTTGVAKAAMLTQNNIASNVWQLVTHLPAAFDKNHKIYLTCLPLYHIYALNLHGLCAFSVGGHNVLIPNARDLDSIVDAMKKYPVGIFVGVNTLFNALCRKENFQKLDFSSLHLTASGGMALTEDAARVWIQTTGCRICEGYGLTETSPVVSGNQPENIHQGTIGAILPETEIKILDDSNNEVREGQAGELCIRGPQVMKGYWHRQDETEKVLSSDGWLRTGDIAQVVEDGFIKIVDRKKDIILVSGFNVYPNEVEDIVCQMPEVVEAAAIGAPDPNCGEIVKLFVVPADPSLTPQQIRAFCKTKLTAYKLPKVVEFRDSLPKSNVGKILRKELRGL